MYSLICNSLISNNIRFEITFSNQCGNYLCVWHFVTAIDWYWASNLYTYIFCILHMIGEEIQENHISFSVFNADNCQLHTMKYCYTVFWNYIYQVCLRYFYNLLLFYFQEMFCYSYWWQNVLLSKISCSYTEFEMLFCLPSVLAIFYFTFIAKVSNL